MARVDAVNLKRLKEEQEKALIQTDRQLEQWNKFRSDYVAVRSRLKTLPNKTTHDVMVPFGSLAFMPGQLVHTNEILVLLGDNYFVERSAVQAADIVTRRLKELDSNIEALKKQREMLTPRAQFTSDMINMASGEGEQKEIMEEYDEDKENQWRERHREYLRQAGKREQKERVEREKHGKKTTVKTDDDYWDILDKLEEQERAREELENLEEDASNPEKESDVEQNPSKFWRGNDEDEDDEEELSSFDEDDGDDDDDNSTAEADDSTDDEDDVDSSRKITFSHSKQSVESSKEQSSPERAGLEPGVINSPADLYRLVKLAPRSILKASSTDSNKRKSRRKSSSDQGRRVSFVGEELDQTTSHKCSAVHSGHRQTGDQALEDTSTQRGKLRTEPVVKAFTDTVVERTAPTAQHSFNPPTPADITKGQNSAVSGRPVSKFRAARQKAEAEATSGDQSHDQTNLQTEEVSPQGLEPKSSRPVSKFRASRLKQGGGS